MNAVSAPIRGQPGSLDEHWKGRAGWSAGPLDFLLGVLGFEDGRVLLFRRSAVEDAHHWRRGGWCGGGELVRRGDWGGEGEATAAEGRL